MKNLFTNLMKNTAKRAQNTGGGASQCQTSRSEGARQITARFESAQMKNTSLISGCSAVDVPIPSYGAPDEHPMSTRSASDGRRWNSRGWKYVACMLMVLVMSIGQMWGTDLEIPLTNLSKFPLDYGLVTITNTENTTISNPNLTVKKATAKFKVETISGFYIKSISFKDANPSKNGGFSCDENASYMTGPTADSIFTYTAPNATTSEANFTLIGSGGTAQIGKIIITVSTSDQVERLSAFGSISDNKIPFTSSAATTCIELSVPASNGVSISSKRIAIPTSAKHLIVSMKNGETIKYIAIPKYQQSTNVISGSSDPSGTYSSDGWTPSSSDVESVDLSLTASGGTTYSQEIFVVFTSAGGGEEKAYTVTAATSTGDNSLGTVSAAASSLDAAEMTTITATPATGYKVTNWAVSGTGASISPSGASNATSTTLTMGSANATVTATFGPKSYTVTLNNQSATTVGTESVTTTYNSSSNLTSAITKPTKTGYVFAGYFTETNGGGTQLIDPAGNWIASAGGGSTYMNSEKNWKNDGNLTLYACWMEYASTFDIEAYVQANVTEGSPTKTFTILETNKLLYNLGGGTELDNSNDATDQYDGLKIKSSGDYVMFLVQAGYSLSVKWGYVKSSQPKYSINGGTAQTFTTLTTGSDNSSSPGDIEISSQSYDQLVKIWTTDGNATVLKKVTIEAPTPSGPSVSSFTPASGAKLKTGATVTVAGSDGSTVYCLWASSAQTASAIKSGTAGSSGAASVTSAGIASANGTTLYAVAVKDATDSDVASATYTIDDTAPTLSSSTPADGANNIPLSGNIVLTFSENVTINDASKFTIYPSAGVTLSTGSATASSNTVTIPYSGLSSATNYTFSTAASAVKDEAGNTSAALSDISFTTANVTYTVTYAGNSPTSGSAPTDSNSPYSSGATVTVLGDNSMSKTGYTFRGWTDGTTFYKEGQKFTISGNTTLTAVWEPSGGTCTEYEILLSDATKESSTKPYGWYVSSKGMIMSKADGSGVADLTTYVGVGACNSSTKGFKTGSSTFAVKTYNDINKLTVYGYTSSARTVSNVYTSSDYTSYVDDIHESCDITESFSKNACGSITIEFPSTVSANNYIKIVLSGNVDSLTSALLENCVDANFDVTFNMKSHGSAISSYAGVPTGKKIVAPTAPTAAGYTFGGWYTDASCTSAWNWESSTVTKDTTLYAKWTANTYDVAVTLTEDLATKKSGTTGTGAATHGTDHTLTFEAVSGYQLPSDVTVTIGGDTKTKGTEYSWSISAGVGTLTIGGSYITGNIAITVTAEVAKTDPTEYTVSGTTSICSGETATITLEDSDDGVTYQLYKDAVAEGDPVTGTGSALEWDVTDEGTYTVKAEEDEEYNEADMDGSAVISYYTATAIGTQPATAVSGHDGVNFTLGTGMVATGQGDLSYKWYSYTSSGGAGEAEVAGAEEATYTTSKSAGTYYYKVEVTGECGSVKSDMITVTVDNKHLLTYDANNGSGAPSGSYLASGSTTLSSTMPTRSGYVFLGWNTNSSGTGDMYQPGATYTMPATATTLYAAWGSPCFSFSKGTTKASEPADDVTITSSNITTYWSAGATLEGGTLTNTSGATLGINGDRGFVMIKRTRELTLTLTGGQFQEGTVITLEGYTNNENSKSYGFALGSVKVGGTKSTESTGAYTAFSQRYVVVADDGIEGTSSVVVKMNGDCTGSQTYLSAIYIGGCMSCTSISPSLSYDKTTIWVGESGATPTLNTDGSTGAVTYASSNTDAATVNESTGEVTAVAHGTTTITATIAADGTHCGKSTTCDITVKEMACEYVEIASAVLTSKTTATCSNATLLQANMSNSSAPYKLNTTLPSYFGLQLSSGNFQVDDSIIFKVKINDMNISGYTQYPVAFYHTTDTSSYTPANALYIADGNTKSTDNVYIRFIVTQEMIDAGLTNKILIIRSGRVTQNHSMYEARIKRYGCADVYYFNDESTSGAWSDEENWLGPAGQGGGLPTIDDRIVINKPMTVDVDDAQAAEIILDKSSSNTGKLTIGAGQALVVAGTIKTYDGSSYSATTPSDIVLESDGTNGTGALITGERSTTTQATVGFYTQAIKHVTRGYVNQYIGIPFSGITAYDRFYDTYVYEYIASSNAWSPLTNNGEMSPYTAYNLMRDEDTETTLYSGGTLVLPGTAAEYKDHDLTLTLRNASATTTNMFANPYTAPIDITALDEDDDFTGIEATIYLFNAGSNYDVSKRSGQTGGGAGQWLVLPVASVKDAPESYAVTTIPSQQAFMVKGTTGASHTMTIDYKKHVYDPAKTSGATINPARAPKQDREETALETMNLTVQGLGGASDRVLMFMREDFSIGFDNGWDGRKMKGKTYVPYLYAATDDGKMAVNSIPTAEGTVLGFKAGTEDNYYTFSFNYNGEDIWYLNDLKEQKSTLINAAETYEFVAEPGDTEARFVISATPIHKITTGNESASAEAAKVRKLIIDDKIYIIRGGRMYSVEGMLVK